MSGKRSKKLMELARIASLDGSVVKSYEYKRLKKVYKNPHYARHVSLESTEPGFLFSGGVVLERKKAGLLAGVQNHKS